MANFWSDVMGWVGGDDSPAPTVTVSQAPDSPEVTQALSEVGIVDTPVGDGGVVSSSISPSAIGARASGGEDAWLGKVLGPAMKQIMGTALRPNVRAPLGGGHGVNASGGTAARVPDTIMKMATLDEPLSNIQSFARLFG